ncbi:MAG: response regulator transcription factor [Deltaproteobacteria bacterium]
MIRVALAEDHTLVREGFRQLLALVEDITLVGEAADGEQAIALVIDQRPDVLLLDMRMPKADGLAVITTLAARDRLVPTLVLTTFDDEHAALELMAAGARGFLLKDVTLDRLVDAVRVIAGGGTVLRPGLSERVANQLRAPAPTGPDITAREREVLRLLAAGYSNREIGRALFVAEGTVKNHVSNILTKLGVRDRTRAVLKALELGYV